LTRDGGASRGPARKLKALGGRGFFIFYFYFLQKYIFDLEIYRNIPRLPGSGAAGTWPPGSWAAGANLQKKYNKKLQTGLSGPVARLRGGRPYFFAI